MTVAELIAAGIVDDEAEALDVVPLEWLEDFGADPQPRNQALAELTPY